MLLIKGFVRPTAKASYNLLPYRNSVPAKKHPAFAPFWSVESPEPLRHFVANFQAHHTYRLQLRHFVVHFIDHFVVPRVCAFFLPPPLRLICLIVHFVESEGRVTQRCRRIGNKPTFYELIGIRKPGPTDTDHLIR